MKKVFSILAVVTAIGFTASAATPQSAFAHKHVVASANAKEARSSKKSETKLGHKKHHAKRKSSKKGTAGTPAPASN